MFIDTLGTTADFAIVRASSAWPIAHVTITAECVENEGQAAMLKKWGCDQVQGFYYGKPETEVQEPELPKVDRPLVA